MQQERLSHILHVDDHQTAEIRRHVDGMAEDR
jgi:hypothetical protein